MGRRDTWIGKRVKPLSLHDRGLRTLILVFCDPYGVALWVLPLGRRPWQGWKGEVSGGYGRRLAATGGTSTYTH